MKQERIPKGLMDELRKKLGDITRQAVYQRIERIRGRNKPAISLVDGAGVLAGKDTDIDLHKYFTVEQVDRIRGLIATLSGAAVVSSAPIVVRERAPRKVEEQRLRAPALLMTDREINDYLKREFKYMRVKIGKRLKKICGDQEELRAILLRDNCDAVRCYAHGSWKPAVILCGGEIEGILSQLIAREPGTSRDAAYLRAYPKQKRARKLKDYKLCHYLDVAAELGIIKPTTAKLGHGVRDYRNYIHPLEELEEEHEMTDGDARIACQLVFKILEEVGK